jgi:hypothetical protein
LTSSVKTVTFSQSQKSFLHLPGIWAHPSYLSKSHSSITGTAAFLPFLCHLMSNAFHQSCTHNTKSPIQRPHPFLRLLFFLPSYVMVFLWITLVFSYNLCMVKFHSVS